MPIIPEVEVLQGTAAAVWLCPQCGHGSPEPRDERAHLDAHRQLRAFFEEWDAGTAPEQAPPARRPAIFYAACALAVLVVWSLTVFSHVNRADDGPRAAPPAAVAPAARPPAVRNEVPPAPPTATPSGSSVSSPAPARRSASPSSTTTATSTEAALTPPPVAASPVPTTPAPAATFPTLSVPPTPRHLISLCLLGICLTVL